MVSLLQCVHNLIDECLFLALQINYRDSQHKEIFDVRARKYFYTPVPYDMAEMDEIVKIIFSDFPDEYVVENLDPVLMESLFKCAILQAHNLVYTIMYEEMPDMSAQDKMLKGCVRSLIDEINFLRLQLGWSYGDMSEEEFDEQAKQYLFKPVQWEMNKLVEVVSTVFSEYENLEDLDVMLICRMFKCDMQQAIEAYNIVLTIRRYFLLLLQAQYYL